MFQNGFLISLFQHLAQVTKLFYFVLIYLMLILSNNKKILEILCPHPGALVIPDGIATLVSNDTTVYFDDQVRYEY